MKQPLIDFYARRTWRPATLGSSSTTGWVALNQIRMAIEDFGRNEVGRLQGSSQTHWHLLVFLDLSQTWYCNVQNFSLHMQLNTEHKMVLLYCTVINTMCLLRIIMFYDCTMNTKRKLFLTATVLYCRVHTKWKYQSANPRRHMQVLWAWNKNRSIRILIMLCRGESAGQLTTANLNKPLFKWNSWACHIDT